MHAWLCENPIGEDALTWTELPTPTPAKGQQGARNANAGNGNKASAYQRPPSNNQQAPTAPGLSTYSSGNNNNWGMGNGNNNGGANSWGNNK